MPGTITPLPVILEEEEDRKAYEALEPPKTIVIRYGYQKRIAELPYDGTDKPGCGSKLVARTDRGLELVEMVTTTCPNSGCGQSVSRKEMLDYIDRSGGRDYPFSKQGKVLRVATLDDLNEQRHAESRKSEMLRLCKAAIADMDLPMALVEVEPLLGGERVVFYYTAENWVDFRELVKRLASELQTRIEMHQVNEREEARLVADYEKCGQHCCCKQFLKVLKPVSMRSAKVQKATLDPQKISGRCGRLMCCLRYEDKTYSDLKKNLPHRKSIVETEDGVGIVLDTQILTQLALVKIGMNPPVAYPIEQIRVLDQEEAKAWRKEQEEREQARESGSYSVRSARKQAEARKPKPDQGGGNGRGGQAQSDDSGSGGDGRSGQKRRRRRRRSGSGGGGEGGQQPQSQDGGGDNVSQGYSNKVIDGGNDGGSGGGQQDGGGGKPKRRRRRRRRRRGGDGGNSGGGSGGGSGGDS